jgi:hypothetical protein
VNSSAWQQYSSHTLHPHVLLAATMQCRSSPFLHFQSICKCTAACHVWWMSQKRWGYKWMQCHANQSQPHVGTLQHCFEQDCISVAWCVSLLEQQSMILCCPIACPRTGLRNVDSRNFMHFAQSLRCTSLYFKWTTRL